MSLRPPATALACLILPLTLTGCASGSDESQAPASTAAAAPEKSPPASTSRQAPRGAKPSPSDADVEMTIEDGELSPPVQRVEAQVGEPVTLALRSDVAGELHVHSVPEQEIAFPAGESTHEVTIDQPGVVEVESHDLGGVVLQLEVS